MPPQEGLSSSKLLPQPAAWLEVLSLWGLVGDQRALIKAAPIQGTTAVSRGTGG